MVMSEAGLRGALDLLFGDEPVIDLYSYGPWRVRDGLVEELSARIDALVADERSSQFTVSKHPELRTPVPAVVADAQGIVAFLCGDVAIRAGSRMRIRTATGSGDSSSARRAGPARRAIRCLTSARDSTRARART